MVINHLLIGMILQVGSNWGYKRVTGVTDHYKWSYGPLLITGQKMVRMSPKKEPFQILKVFFPLFFENYVSFRWSTCFFHVKSCRKEKIAKKSFTPWPFVFLAFQILLGTINGIVPIVVNFIVQTFLFLSLDNSTLKMSGEKQSPALRFPWNLGWLRTNVLNFMA